MIRDRSLTPHVALGRRVAEGGAGLLPGFSYSAPFDDVRLK